MSEIFTNSDDRVEHTFTWRSLHCTHPRLDFVWHRRGILARLAIHSLEHPRPRGIAGL